LIASGLGIVFFAPNAADIVERLRGRMFAPRLDSGLRYSIWCGGLLAIALFCAYIGGGHEFIYFQF
jgi:hypothetical protein